MKDYKNNSQWIVENFGEWIEKGLDSVKELYDNATNENEKLRLLEKYNTLIMVSNKFEELKNN
jgi:hypothetical protein